MLILTLTLLGILVLGLVAEQSGRTPDATDGRLVRMLASRGVVVAVFLVTFLLLWYSWAAVNPIPVVHDEMAYVLQAEIFARGKWALPSPPIPLFWEQPHILTEPKLAAKYFPGHALALAPGAFLGWPALIPLVLQSVSASLLFVLARRIASGGVAFMAWIIWLFSPIVLYFGPTYFSEATTTACWLAGWYALLEWRESRRLGWLAAVAFFTGWDVITRPLTGVAYAIPMAAVILWDVVQQRRWRDFAVALAVGSAVMAILPLWSARTTGNWSLTPLTLYTRLYMPYDVPGFGVVSTPPAHSVTPDLYQLNNAYRSPHVTHFPSTLLKTLSDRTLYLSVSVWGTTAGALSVFALLGLRTLGGPATFALVSALCLLASYLLYATPAQWTLYYYESVPVYAYLSAAGLAWAASLIRRPRGAPRSPRFTWRSTRWSTALLAAAVIFVLPGFLSLQLLHAQHISDRRYLAPFHRLLGSIHDARAVVFVRYSRAHNSHVTFVRNTANPDSERIWVVYDRGDAENSRLLSLAPGRKSYLFDESQRRIYLYDPVARP